VLRVVTMAPGRIGLPRLRARHVLETAAGRCAQWGVVRGVGLDVAWATRPGHHGSSVLDI
jgi:hypothetical protein